jgi:glycine amidinotransferase
MQRLLDKIEPGAKVHKIYKLDDNHIDGVLMVLKPGVFLVNNDYVKKPHLHDIKKYLPEKFQNWKYIYIEDNPDTKASTKNGILDSRTTDFLQLCSIRGSFTNVLSIDENTVCVNKDAIKTI